MANLAEMRSDNYKIFNRFESAKRQEMIEVVEYINMMASTTATPIVDWNLRELFGVREEGTNELVTDRREINRRFWAKANSQEVVATPQASELGEVITGRLARLAAEKATALRASFTNNINGAYNNASAYYARAERELAEMARYQRELESISTDGPDLAGEVQKIIDLGFFEIQPDLCTESTLVFLTPEVICDYSTRTEVTPPAVNMGRYKVVWNFTANNIKVKRYSRNRSYGGNIHPFISSGGGICWGNEGNIISDHWRNYRWSAIFGILANILQRFDVTSHPYAQLGSFVDVTPSPERTGTMDQCPDCGSTDTTEDEDDSGEFFVCNACGHDWE